MMATVGKCPECGCKKWRVLLEGLVYACWNCTYPMVMKRASHPTAKEK